MSGSTGKKKTNKKTEAKNTTNNSKAKKNSSNKKSNTNSINHENSFIKREIVLLLFSAFSILLLISCFGLGGSIGAVLGDFMYGTFGTLAVLFPIILFFGTIIFIANKKNAVIIFKLISAVIAFLLICSLIQVFAVKGSMQMQIKELYEYGVMRHISGGVVGGILVSLLYPALGMVGQVIVTAVLLLICIVIITEHSFVQDVKKGSRKVADKAKVDAQKRKEKAIIRKEEKEKEKTLRMDKKVTGVALDTKILPVQEKGMHEIGVDPAAAKPMKSDLNKIEIEEPQAKVPVTENHEEPQALKENVSDLPIGKEAFTITGIHKKDESVIPFEAPKESSPVHKENETASQKDEDVLIIPDHPEKTQEKEYLFPPIDLLKKGNSDSSITESSLRETANKLQQTLHSFGVNVSITNISCGPTVTRYELLPEQGVKVSRIVGLSDDIKLNLAAADIRIEAPIPGKAAVGIEVPNKENSAVMLRDLLESPEFKNHGSNIAFAAGKDIAGQPVVTDIAKMPHLLIAGATGSGKSVCINTIIMSIIYKANPNDVKLIMIDPKVVELSVYNGIPHLFIPVVTDPKKAAGALNWAVAEMMERYEKFAQCNVRDLKGYNEKIESLKDIESDEKPNKLPQIVIIVDELADLMMVAPGEVEDAICRLAQLARAAGIHLIIATQRPSVNVITGLIKANMPSRIAFSVSSGVDSRTILDMNGAEKLLGKGDMLFYPQGYQKPARVQGAFVSDAEVGAVVSFLTEEHGASYNKDIEDKMNMISQSSAAVNTAQPADDRDSYFMDAGKLIIDKDKASIGMLQRYFKIGFNRAARIMDQLEEAGVVGPEEGTKPRKVLMSTEEFEQYIEEYV